MSPRVVYFLSAPSTLHMASALEELWKDLEEVKVLLEKSPRKGACDVLTDESSKTETQTENKMQPQESAELLDNK